MIRRIGVHVSIAGNIWEALERAKALGCNAMQIFSRNPRGWQAAELASADVERFKTLKEEYDIRPIVIHIPYIINLASPDDNLYKKSIVAYIEDIERSDMLGAECFVTHLGSHVGSGEDEGIKRFSRALDDIIKKVRPEITILLENTAGSGSWIGYKFEHIKSILESLSNPEKVGVCLDTAHTFEAGYDIKTKKGLEDTLKKFDKLIGLDLVKVVHFNDSLSTIGSHVDRHQHIGKGNIGLEAMKRIVNHPALRNAAFILETPKESDADDRRNLAIVKRMVKR
ncbi:MAG: deoxyribonuclease IV [Candidatus Omnitrophica bacterium]|nr:deoxyribonuclease IV [Candidatus Omnitrophota bacterium]